MRLPVTNVSSKRPLNLVGGRGPWSAPRRMKGDRVAIGITGNEEATEGTVGKRAEDHAAPLADEGGPKGRCRGRESGGCGGATNALHAVSRRSQASL